MRETPFSPAILEIAKDQGPAPWLRRLRQVLRGPVFANKELSVSRACTDRRSPVVGGNEWRASGIEWPADFPVRPTDVPVLTEF